MKSAIGLVLLDLLCPAFGYPDWTEKRVDGAEREQLVPKMFHQIWFDFGTGNGESVPSGYEKLTKDLLEMHSDWRYKLWSERDVEALVEKHLPDFLIVFRSYTVPVKKHDAARIAVLLVEGGVYLDHDFVSLRPIEPLLAGRELVMSAEGDDNLVINGFIGAIKGHRFLRELLQAMACRTELPVYEAVGPALISSLFYDWHCKSETKGIAIYHPKFLVPVSRHSRPCRHCSRADIMRLYPEAFMLQLYDGSWLSNEPNKR